MTRIRVLPPDVARKIAAGEVVERPVSVVKELVENALDAGAAAIEVELLAGGKALIRVRDDGRGMGRADAELCFVRHATSKITSEDDLLTVETLGFRGEALASIAAVSRVILTTAEDGGGPGTRVEREGGEAGAVREAAHPRGTTVEVRDLFFNLPARRAFLRSDASELGAVVKYLTSVALAYPRLRLRAAHGERAVLDGPPVEGLRERLFQLFGPEALGRLIEVAAAEGETSIAGFASRPPGGRGDRSHQVFFVNARPVRDKLLSAALNQAYRGLLEKDRSPEAYLFLAVPPGEVDVNVHPAKAEVRFRKPSAIHALIARAVAAASGRAVGLKEISPVPPDAESLELGSAAAPPSSFGAPPSRIEEAAGLFGAPLERAAGLPARRVLGQMDQAYIIVEDSGDLLVVDQHNAHERVLFERYEEIDRKGGWPVAGSLVPIVFEASPAQAVALESGRELLERSGFRVEPMGGRSFALREHPDIFSAAEALPALLALLEEIGEGPAEDRRQRLLATMACRSAVKAGQPLPREKMEFLVGELFKTSNPAVCPHGRPIVIRVPRAEIERGLRRPKV